jgi:hypothetical protein
MSKFCIKKPLITYCVRAATLRALRIPRTFGSIFPVLDSLLVVLCYKVNPIGSSRAERHI